MPIRVIKPGEVDETLTDEDRELDVRMKAAVEAAINRAKICKKPIARYDATNKKAYLEYPNGEKQYV